MGSTPYAIEETLNQRPSGGKLVGSRITYLTLKMPILPNNEDHGTHTNGRVASSNVRLEASFTKTTDSSAAYFYNIENKM